jgi:hypothetical protein
MYTCSDNIVYCDDLYTNMPMYASVTAVSVQDVDLKNIMILFNSKISNEVLSQFKVDMQNANPGVAF